MLGIYVVASWVVLQVVDVLQGVMPLPEWFAGFAVGLVLGLPIVRHFVALLIRSPDLSKRMERRPREPERDIRFRHRLELLSS